MQGHSVVLFSTPSCSWCRHAKNYFNQKRIRFREFDVSKDEAARNDMIKASGQTGVPVILIDRKPVVGFDLNKIERLLGIRNG
ncbi:MAG: NrdH-redoxin [Spirochaetes bacterium GWF1_51_8]|nr:MAG: NrdH-redoxin [Spirochaetes bacterium GWF1_51_8]